MARKYEGVNENKVKFLRQFTVESENRGIRKNLNISIAKRESINCLGWNGYEVLIGR